MQVGAHDKAEQGPLLPTALFTTLPEHPRLDPHKSPALLQTTLWQCTRAGACVTWTTCGRCVWSVTR